MKEILLTQGKVAQVDDEDYEYLNQWKWNAARSSSNKNLIYAIRHIKGDHTKMVKMHRVIMKTPVDTHVDHIDHNGLNNQKSNLRNCTASQNAMNSKKCFDGRSKFKGVWICKEINETRNRIRIRAAIRINGKLINLGTFKTEVDAALAYNNAALHYFGEFANINKIA